MEVRVYYDDQSQLQQMINLNLEGDIFPNGEALLYIIQSELDLIDGLGLRYRIEKDNIREFAANFWQSQDNTREAYHTMQDIIDLADSLAGAFPAICEKHIFGTSVDGVELGALKITDNVSINENEAEIMFDGGIHGDEIGGPENIIRFARELCLEYGTDPTITNLIDNREIWLYYMVNPDGRDSLTRQNQLGVDLNRDFGYMWDGWGASYDAFSQVESKALRDIIYIRNFVVHTTYHSGTEFISHPWSYRSSQCPDYSQINQLAGLYSSTSGYANMEYGQGSTGMYSINGSTKDTNYGAMGSISWSMEISYLKQPSATQILTYYNYNKPAMLAMIEYAGFGLEGTVTDVNTGEPVTANVFIDEYFPCYTDPAVGDYHKYVLTGTYDITIVANGYESQTITDVSVSQNSSTVTDFQMQPLEGHYIYKICSSRIPDNNPTDEGDTPGVIGLPDNRNYSIGRNGWIVVDMQYPILDVPGDDIQVYEGDTSAEGYTVYASESSDGPWEYLGAGVGTQSFDLEIGNLMQAQYVKILDDGDGLSLEPDAGFDLDAISSMEVISGTYLELLDYYVDDSATNGNGCIEPGETVDIVVTLQNIGDLAAIDTIGDITTTSPYLTLDISSSHFGNIDPSQIIEGIYTITADENIPVGINVDLILDINANSGSYSCNYVMFFFVGGWLLEEYFDIFPPDGWSTNGGTNWQGSNTNFAGGIAPEADFFYAPPSSSTQRLISPVIDTNDYTSLNLNFKHFLDDYYGGYSIRVETISAGGNWQTVWEENPTGSNIWEIVHLEIINSDVGSESFQFAFTFDGDSYNIDHWYIDDVTLSGESNDLFPPQDLSADIIDYNSSIMVYWEDPDLIPISRDLLGYNVYFDGEFIEIVLNSPYTFTGPFGPDLYFIEVAAVYDDGESYPANINVSILLYPPENLTAFSSGNDIILNWDVPNPARGIDEYYIYRDGTFITSTSDTNYTDEDLNSGNYTYHVTVNYDGDYESDPIEVTIEHVDSDQMLVPNVTELSGIYPNPFNPSTTISFSLNENAHTNISVFNIKGQNVRTLTNGKLNAGYHNIKWNGNDEQEKPAASGIYFVIMDLYEDSNNFTSIKKIILLK